MTKGPLRFLKPAAVLLVFSAAVWLLVRELREVNYRDLRAAWEHIPATSIAAAAGLTAVYYLLLIGYDVLAIRYTGAKVPLGKIALASFTGYVGSYNFGILLGGASIRYRLYSAWGLSPLKIAQVIVILGVTFWLGVLALGGAVFVLKPLAIPANPYLPIFHARTLGLVLLAAVTSYLALCGLYRRPIRLLGREIPLPSLRMGFAQVALASADLAVGAAIFHTILSTNFPASYWTVLGAYILSFVAGIFTQVPGGLGVFEVLLLLLLAPSDPHVVLAAVLVWRAVFYLAPLVVGAVLFGAYELVLLKIIRW